MCISHKDLLQMQSEFFEHVDSHNTELYARLDRDRERFDVMVKENHASHAELQKQMSAMDKQGAIAQSEASTKLKFIIAGISTFCSGVVSLIAAFVHWKF
jgi:hypothetical protein